jgi:hypothetical protein
MSASLTLSGAAAGPGGRHSRPEGDANLYSVPDALSMTYPGAASMPRTAR